MRSLAYELQKLARDVAIYFLIGCILGLLVALTGCGEITEVPVVAAPAPAADAGPVRGQADSGIVADAGVQDASPWLPTQSPDGDENQDLPSVRDAAPAPPDAGAPDVRPEHPVANCVPRSTADYRITVCKEGCGTCAKLGEVGTFAQGCWTMEDFHCVASCAECGR